MPSGLTIPVAIAPGRISVLWTVVSRTALHGRTAAVSHRQGTDTVDWSAAAVIVSNELLRIDNTSAGASPADISVSGVRWPSFDFRCRDKCSGCNNQECKEFLHRMLNGHSRRSTTVLPNLFNRAGKTFTCRRSKSLIAFQWRVRLTSVILAALSSDKRNHHEREQRITYRFVRGGNSQANELS